MVTLSDRFHRELISVVDLYGNAECTFCVGCGGSYIYDNLNFTLHKMSPCKEEVAWRGDV